MINCIAIDDEPMALEIIKALCQNIPYLNLSHTFTQVSKAQNHLKNYPTDLIFLDIQMPDLDGIKLYKSIKQDVMVIFTTAYSKYAIDGFDLNAVDFLLKPISAERFQLACNRVKELYTYNKSNNQKDTALYVRSEYSLVKIPYSDILYIETLGDYVKIFTPNNSPVLTLSSLKNIYEKLPSDRFIRVHRSYIVQLSKIDSIRGKVIYLKSIKIPIGASYRKALNELFSSGN